MGGRLRADLAVGDSFRATWPSRCPCMYVVAVWAYPELVAEYMAFAMDNPAWVAKGGEGVLL